MPPEIEWSVVVEAENGRRFSEVVANEAAADSKITIVKGQASGTWFDFAGVSIRAEKMLVIRKNQTEKPTSE